MWLVFEIQEKQHHRFWVYRPEMQLWKRLLKVLMTCEAFGVLLKPHLYY